MKNLMNIVFWKCLGSAGSVQGIKSKLYLPTFCFFLSSLLQLMISSRQLMFFNGLTRINILINANHNQSPRGVRENNCSEKCQKIHEKKPLWSAFSSKVTSFWPPSRLFLRKIGDIVQNNYSIKLCGQLVKVKMKFIIYRIAQVLWYKSN